MNKRMTPLWLAAALVAATLPVLPPTLALGLPIGGDDETGLQAENEPPIWINLTADSSPSVGATIVVHADLTSYYEPSPSTVVALDVPTGVSVMGSASTQINLAQGVKQRVDFTIVVLTDGQHLISVRAWSLVPGSISSGYRQAYLNVPAAGSGNFYVDHFPLSEVSLPAVQLDPSVVVVLPGIEPGAREGFTDEMPGAPPSDVPLRSMPTDRPAGEAAGTPAAAGSQFQVKACFSYETETANTFARQRLVFVQVLDQDGGFDDDVLATGLTGNDGCFTSGLINRAESDCCNRGNQDVYVRFVACNESACIREPTTTKPAYDSFSTTKTVNAESLLDMGLWGPPSTERFAWRPYQYVNNAWDWVVNTGQFPKSSLGRSDTIIPSGNKCTENGGMCYDLDGGLFGVGANTIHMPANGIADKSPDDVGHEFGHFVQDQAYQNNFWPSPNGQHNLCQDNQHRGLSWVEGFANFIGARADREMSGVSGATGDLFYKRPGTSINENMETGVCGGVAGDDNEMNVARSLWDLRDSEGDGFDGSSDTFSKVVGTLRACTQDSTYQEFYDIGCSWVQQSNNRCNFLTTAFQNAVDYNNAPTATVTSPNSFFWLRGGTSVSATLSDPEGCGGTSVEFRLSNDATCSSSDSLIGTDSTSPYSAGFDSNNFGDTRTMFACALGRDSMETGAWDRSDSAFGIDNSPPTGGAKPVLNLLPVAIGTFTVSWNAADSTSGLSGRLNVQEQVNSGGWSNVCGRDLSSGTSTDSGSCSRTPLTPGTYCYRIVVSDVAGNQRVSEGTGDSCAVYV